MGSFDQFPLAQHGHDLSCLTFFALTSKFDNDSLVLPDHNLEEMKIEMFCPYSTFLSPPCAYFHKILNLMLGTAVEECLKPSLLAADFHLACPVSILHLLPSLLQDEKQTNFSLSIFNNPILMVILLPLDFQCIVLYSPPFNRDQLLVATP